MVPPPGKVLPCPRGLRGSAARTWPDEPSPKTFTEVRGRRSHKSHVLHSAPSSPSHFTLSRAALGRHCQSGQTPSLGLPWQLSGRGCTCKTPRGQRGVRGCRGQARQLPAQIGGCRFAPAQAGACFAGRYSGRSRPVTTVRRVSGAWSGAGSVPQDSSHGTRCRGKRGSARGGSVLGGGGLLLSFWGFGDSSDTRCFRRAWKEMVAWATGQTLLQPRGCPRPSGSCRRETLGQRCCHCGGCSGGTCPLRQPRGVCSPFPPRRVASWWQGLSQCPACPRHGITAPRPGIGCPTSSQPRHDGAAPHPRPPLAERGRVPPGLQEPPTGILLRGAGGACSCTGAAGGAGWETVLVSGTSWLAPRRQPELCSRLTRANTGMSVRSGGTSKSSPGRSGGTQSLQSFIPSSCCPRANSLRPRVCVWGRWVTVYTPETRSLRRGTVMRWGIAAPGSLLTSLSYTSR